METLHNLDYPKQYILIEKEDTRIFRILNNKNDYINIEDYLYGVITVIQEVTVDNVTYSEIQYDDRKLGWIRIKNSIQIFRFKKQVFRFIEEGFISSTINEKMNLNKDFKTHLSNKLLNIKSEIKYNDEWLYGVFIKDRFFGFHPKKNFESIIECEIELTKNEVEKLDLYRNNSMKTTVTKEVYYETPKIVSFFKENKVGRIKVNKKDFFWISLAGFEEKIKDFKEVIIDRSLEQKYLDDVFYSLYLERIKSKEIVKTVLLAKSYIHNKRYGEVSDYETDIIENPKARKKLKELERNNNKLLKELQLSNRRLEQKKDYSNRLEMQKDKYKARMIEVEDKIKSMMQKMNEKK